VLTYDGVRLRVGATSDEELEHDYRSVEGARIYAGLKSLRDRYGPLIRTKYPNIPAARFRIQPELSSPGK